MIDAIFWWVGYFVCAGLGMIFALWLVSHAFLALIWRVRIAAGLLGDWRKVVRELHRQGKLKSVDE